ncbi:MAG: peptidoglycan bridge formation glycyltransferase FemA/FemB family protein [Bacillota bacterium]|nr:peptidoglycan bridge formation glycyltransferase FemA/FemB family protein [Bacillota bacterium]
MYTCRLLEQRDHSYDSYILNHPYGHLFQSYPWGELKKSFGWQPFRLIVYEGVRTAAAVTLLSHRLFNDCSLVYAPRGPVMHFDNEHLLGFLLEKTAAVAQLVNAVFLKIDPALPRLAGRAHNQLLKRGFKQVDQIHPHRSLQLTEVYRIHLPYQNRSHSALIKNMGRMNRLSVEWSQSREKLKIFYALLLEYSELTDIKVRSFSYYQRMWDLLQEFGIYLFLVKQKNYVIGASLLITFGSTCYSLYCVYRQRHLGLYPESFLHLAIMEWAAKAGCVVYEIIDTLLTTKQTSSSPRLFSFPVEPYTYLGEFDLVYRPWHYRLWNILYPIYNWSVKV